MADADREKATVIALCSMMSAMLNRLKETDSQAVSALVAAAEAEARARTPDGHQLQIDAVRSVTTLLLARE